MVSVIYMEELMALREQARFKDELKELIDKGKLKLHEVKV